MGRRIRFIPPDSLVEVTCRTVQGRCLMTPTPEIVDLTRGVLARAARLYPVEIHAFCFLSNHFHILLTVSGADRLAAFMNHLNSNLAREIGRQVRWREKFWGRRYQAILVSDEEAAQVERLLYVLRHGCKENLVRRPAEWPGATSTEALLRGERVRGTWFDRSREYVLSRRRTVARREETTREESLELAPLPCWRHLTAEAHRKRCQELVESVEAETERRIRETGQEPLGCVKILRQHPHLQTSRPRSGPTPLAHAASRSTRQQMYLKYRAFAASFYHASACLRLGVASAAKSLQLFPAGSFLPPRLFVATG